MEEKEFKSQQGYHGKALQMLTRRAVRIKLPQNKNKINRKQQLQFAGGFAPGP
jgi:hypothetical protein